MNSSTAYRTTLKKTNKVISTIDKILPHEWGRGNLQGATQALVTFFFLKLEVVGSELVVKYLSVFLSMCFERLLLNLKTVASARLDGP